MSKIKNQTTSGLPYRMTLKRFEKGITTLRQSPGSPEALAIALGNERHYVMRSFGILGIAEPNTQELTTDGREIAYSDGEEQQKNILRILVKFFPYKIVLTETAQKSKDQLSANEIASIWGREKIGSNDQVRYVAAVTLVWLMEASGLGNFIAGRRGEPSRIVLQEGFQEKIAGAFSPASKVPHTEKDDPKPDPSGSQIKEKTKPPDKNSILVQFPLRPDLIWEFRLPKGLTKKDVDRLKRFLDAFALEEDDGE